MGRLTVDDSEVRKLFSDLSKMGNSVIKDAYPYLRNQTPIKGGNARNKTKLRGQTILSDYGYAERLDTGWSKQAPNGFTDPTINQIDKLIDNYIDRVD